MGETRSENMHSMQTKEDECVSVEWPNHNDIFVENVWRLYSRGIQLDLDVECGEKVLGAHWVIMSALCELLTDARPSPPSETVSNKPRSAVDPCRFKLEFDGAVNDQLCRCFIEFLYRGKTSLPKDSLQGFLSVLKQVGVRGLDRIDVHNPTPSTGQDSCSQSISEDETPPEDEKQIDNVPEVSAVEGEDVANSKDVTEGQHCVDHNYVESCPELSVDKTTENEPETVVKDVCASVLKSVVEAVDEELSKLEEKVTEDDEVKELVVENETDVNGNQSKDSDDIIVLDSPCGDSPKEDNLVISEAVHCCSCSLSLKECDGRYFCLVDNALLHCGCRLRQQETLTVLFDKAQPVDVEGEAQDCFTETECGQCSTTNIPIDVKIKSKHNKDTTRFYLDSYVTNMIDLSLSDGEFDDECVVTFDRSKAKKSLTAIVGRTATVQQRATRAKSAIFEKWCNLSQLKRNEPRKPLTNAVSTSTQTDPENICAVSKEFKPLEKEEIATLGDSFKLILDKLDSETNLVCKLCRCKCSGVASFGLHMIATHHFVFSEKTDTKSPDPDKEGGVEGGRGRTILFCSYCDFRAVSQRLLACHLTDTHRELAVTPGLSARVTRESERKRLQTAKASMEGNGDYVDEIRCINIKSEPEDESKKETTTKRTSARIKYPNENEDDEESDDEEDDDFHVAKSTEHYLKRKVSEGGDETPKRVQSKRRVTFASPQKRTSTSPPPSPSVATTSSRSKPKQPASPKKTTTEPESHHCSKCGYETPSVFALKCHHLEHTTKSPFSCVSCREKFATKSSLMMHMMKHAKPNDYFTCTRCRYRTPWKGRFDAHLVKTHNIKVRYDCHICQKSYTSSSNLDSHRRSSHYQKPSKSFHCPKCKHVATDAKQLYSHVFLKHISNT